MTDAAPAPAQEGDRPRLPHPRDLSAALGLLTALPLPRPDYRSDAFARAVFFFPVAGLLVGLLLAGVRVLIGGRLSGWTLGIGLIAVWEGVARAALLRVWKNGTARWDRGRAAAAAGALIGVAIKVVCLAQPGGSRPVALLFAPLLAGWSIVVIAVGARDADAPGRKFNAAITFQDFAWTSVLTFAVVFAIADAFGIVIVVGTAAVTLAVRLLAHHWADGVSWRLLLVAGQGVEAFVLTLCAVL